MFRFNPRDANDIITEFFNNSSLFEGMDVGGMRGGTARSFGRGMFSDNVFASFTKGRSMSQGPRKDPTIEKTLPCSLEEIYKGTTKKMKISRAIPNASR